MFLTRESEVPFDRNDVVNINKLIVELADSLDKPCCATCDAHFLNKEDGKNARIEYRISGALQADRPLYKRIFINPWPSVSYIIMFAMPSNISTRRATTSM